MVLAVGCVHPAGEAADYDGLYFRDVEMEGLAEGLTGLPLCVEHMQDHPVGQVVRAWVDPEDRRCYALFETDGSFGGCVAGRLLHHGECGELSLGHTCELNASADQVVRKVPTEISICAKGARERTEVYGRTAPPRARAAGRAYISVQASAPLHLAMTTPATDAPPAPIESQQIMQKLLEQVKSLTEQNTLRAKEMETLKAQKEQFEGIAARHEAVGKRKREHLVESSIKDFFAGLMENNAELEGHREVIDTQLENMKGESSMDGMLATIACAAAQSKKSTVELEAAYQENKRLKKALEEQQKGSFAAEASRVIHATASAGEAAPIAARAPSGARDMKTLYPEMYQSLQSGTSSTSGIPSFGTKELFARLNRRAPQP